MNRRKSHEASVPRASTRGTWYLGLDLFPRRVHLRLPSGKDKYQTCGGAFFSVIYVLTVIAAATFYILEQLEI